MPKDESEWIVIENHHEPIIDEIQYERVQMSLQRNYRGGYKRGETHVRKNIHIFAGMMKCGNCGSNMSATIDRRRASGFCPSIYGCSTRRQSKNKCKNKFVSDAYIGPFVFNYIANIIRASKTMSNSTSVTVLERKLLRGNSFSGVEHIGQEELSQMRELLLSGRTGLEFNPVHVLKKTDEDENEKDILKERKRKAEIAINRLKSLYLYGEEQLPEKEYLIERQKLLDEIAECDEKISKIRLDEIEWYSDSDDFLKKSSYFIMVENLLDERTIDFEKYIMSTDNTIPKNFINSVIEQIEVADGRITTIRFKNGMIHTFTYKSEAE